LIRGATPLKSPHPTASQPIPRSIPAETYLARQANNRTETDLLREVSQYLRARNVWFRRYNTRALRVGARLMFTIIGPDGKVATGHPDLMARAPASGRPVWIETKSKNGSLSDPQLAFRDEVVARFGDLYLAPRTLEEVMVFFEPGRSFGRRDPT